MGRGVRLKGRIAKRRVLLWQGRGAEKQLNNKLMRGGRRKREGKNHLS